MAEDSMIVTLTLPRKVAEKLRGICHSEGRTASELVEGFVAEWVPRGMADAEGGDLLEGLKDFGSKIAETVRAAKESGALDRGAVFVRILLAAVADLRRELDGAPEAMHEVIKGRFLGELFRKLKEHLREF